MKRLSRPARRYIATGAALILTGVLIFVLTQISLFGFFQSRASKSLGREFSVANYTIDWDWKEPRVQAQGVKIANDGQSADANMLEISDIFFSIRIWELLRGRVELPEMTIHEPRLILEKYDEDHNNWELPLFSQGNVVAETALPDNRYDFPVIGILKITDGNMAYRDKTRDLDLQLTINTAQGTAGEGKEQLEVKGQGTLQKQKFLLEAKGGSLNMLRNTSEEFPLDLKIEMGPTKVSLRGNFTDPVHMEGIKASLDINGNNMADLYYLTAIPLPPTPPYKLGGMLKKEKDVWSYEDFSGMVGDSVLKGALNYDTGGERGFLKAELVSEFMDMDDLGGFIGMTPSTDPGETAAPEQRRKAVAQEASPFVLPDVPINLNRLRSADMDVSLHAKKLNAPGIPFKGMNTRFVLREGHLRLDPMDISLADGSVHGWLELDGRKGVPTITTQVDFMKLALSRFVAGTRFEENTNGLFGGNLKLTGSGVSFPKILADSDGRIVMMIADGQISLLLMEAADLDIAEGVPLLLGDDSTTRIRCGVGDFKVNNGILTSQTFVFDTDDSILQGQVIIDLYKELIDARLDAESKDPSLLALQTPIYISGHWKDPAISLEPLESGTRAAGAVALGTLLTPLAAILPFLETGVGKNADCNALLTHAHNTAASSQP